MRNFEKVNMTLFDSTNANFKLSVEAQFTRLNPDGSKRSLVYSTEKLTAVLNPNLYLVLSCKSGDDVNPVYTSYPQIFALRSALETVRNYCENGFVNNSENVLTVKSNYAQSVVVENIGKKNNWVSFKLVVISSGENGIVTALPGVSIEMSTSNRFVSTLTLDEFYTIYSIINDINLPALQATLSLGYLNIDTPMGYGYNNFQPQFYPRNNGYTPPPQGGQSYNTPTYNQQPRQQRPRQMAPANPAPSRNFAEPFPANNSPAPSSSTPVMNMKAVEETPIADISYDDTDAINDLFN